MFPLSIRPEAEEDLTHGYDWYEKQREGLGNDFLDEIENTLTSIESSPELYPKVHRDIRRALTGRFPYGIFYMLERELIDVIAILHTSRNPARWKGRAWKRR